MEALIAQGVVLGFAAAVQPGPLQTYIIVQTLKNGWQRSAVMALAPLLSDGPIIVLAILVLSQMGPRVQHFLFGLSAIALCGLGLYQLCRGLAI